MSKGWEYKSGDWLVICDSCSKKLKASQTKERWDGFRVCPECWEPRHPIDFIRVRSDKISVPFTRPQPTDIFNEVIGFIDIWEVSDTFSTLREYVRDHSDSVETTDSTVYEIGSLFSEEVSVADGLSLISSSSLGLTDTVTMASSGDIFTFDYLDSTYVGLDYVGTSAGTIT